ncbi:uncharacterized protein N7503_011375 [Penicillium pulvis]|uniref:uncharacterized protein n=1 Tax=Penicillium pulvis TaxID=1562058 RepID=UPI0025499DC6|nr:uncharacterized protein N7503_011375 [Penicillium pulvis]KAJ5786163.1 hypothetical protein N7503_011375 [Penicillium pulvis]
MARERFGRFFRKRQLGKDDEKISQSRQMNHFRDDSLTHHASAIATKPDLWQRAFDALEPKKQQLIKSISIPELNKTIDSNDVKINSSVTNRLKALNGVVETVKTQYQVDQGKSKIREPAQKIIKAVLGFQDLVQAAVAFDPTGHATSVWAVVSLGLVVCSNSPFKKILKNK